VNRSLASRLLGSPRAMVGLGILGLLTAAAVFAPLLTPYDPFAQNLALRSRGPSWEHWLGTDQLGRDLFTRLLYGARISLVAGVGSVLIGTFLGTIVGTVAGYYGGRLDSWIMAANDVFLGFRTYLLAILVVAVLGTSLINLTVAIGLALFPQLTRLIRAEVLSVRNREFAEAARALGAQDVSILARHILPQTISPVVVAATFYIATAIVVESSLSFLGLGPAPPTPSWGLMISDGLRYLLGNYWLAIIPGTAIMITVLAFNLLGDALRDVLDPRLVKR
jgi:peptide/nickel transport system permease protein